VVYTNSFLTLNARSTLVNENEFKKCNVTPQETTSSNCKLRNVDIRIDITTTQEVGPDKEKTVSIAGIHESIPDEDGIETNNYILAEKGHL